MLVGHPEQFIHFSSWNFYGINFNFILQALLLSIVLIICDCYSKKQFRPTDKVGSGSGFKKYGQIRIRFRKYGPIRIRFRKYGQIRIRSESYVKIGSWYVLICEVRIGIRLFFLALLYFRVKDAKTRTTVRDMERFRIWALEIYFLFSIFLCKDDIWGKHIWNKRVMSNM